MLSSFLSIFRHLLLDHPGIDPVAPYLEAQMPDGSWKRILDDMGFPAGLPHTIVVDLTGKLPAGTRKVRISTNLQIYWDQVLIDNAPDSTKFRTTELPLVGSSLAFRGYPQQIDGQTPGDRWSNAAVPVGMIPVATVLFLGMDLVIHQMGAK